MVDAIISEREAHGPFADIFDFAERVPGMNRKALETLVNAGAFDSFGARRTQFFLPCKNNVPFIDELVNYADCYHHDTIDAGSSLFGEMEEMKPVRPEMPPMSGEEDELAKLQKEKELVGMYISSHPLDKYTFELETFTTCPISSLNDLVAECERKKTPQKVSVAGLVTDTKNLTTRTGRPFSRTVLEDYNGSYELALFGKDHEKFLGKIQLHEALFIEGEIGGKFTLRPEEKAQGKTAPYTLKVKDIALLGNMSDSLLSGFSIQLTTPMLTQEFRKKLVKLLAAHKGLIPLNIYLTDPVTHYRIEFFSKKFQVAVNADFIRDVKALGVPYSVQRKM